jgi:hypothetical protein
MLLVPPITQCGGLSPPVGRRGRRLPTPELHERSQRIVHRLTIEQLQLQPIPG